MFSFSALVSYLASKFHYGFWLLTHFVCLNFSYQVNRIAYCQCHTPKMYRQFKAINEKPKIQNHLMFNSATATERERNINEFGNGDNDMENIHFMITKTMWISRLCKCVCEGRKSLYRALKTDKHSNVENWKKWIARETKRGNDKKLHLGKHNSWFSTIDEMNFSSAKNTRKKY